MDKDKESMVGYEVCNMPRRDGGTKGQGTRSLLGLAQKNICNIIEEIVFKNCTFFTFFRDNFFNYVSNMLPSKSKSRLGVQNIKNYSKL